MTNYEQPEYSVVHSGDGYEIRHYESYLVAETTVHGDFDSVGTTAFRRLAGFIFGRNTDGVKMNMTFPVTRESAGPGKYRYRFVMEKAYSEAELPRPVDEEVRIVRVPAGFHAAARYRGSRNESPYRRAEVALRATLDRDGIAVSGTPASAVYDGPFTPSFMRRNEVLVPVDWHDDRAA